MWFIAAIGVLLAVSFGFALWALWGFRPPDSDEPDWYILGLVVFDALLWIVVLFILDIWSS